MSAQDPKPEVKVAAAEARAEAKAEAKAEPKPEFPPFAEVSKDFEPVPAPDGAFYHLWHRKKDGQLLAELPAEFESHRQFFALTTPGGESFGGLQSGDRYVYWKRFDKRLALIEPNLGTRSSGDQESKDSVRRLFTDRVLLDLEIQCIGPNNQPVIDLDELLLGHLPTFYSTSGVKRQLASVLKAKVFPKNIEVSFEAPDGDTFKTFHFSISEIQPASDYKPRAADDRVGYFVTSFRDMGKMREDQVWQRRINRWHLEKADASLKLSPPKKPIVFYLEHTVPVRYRRFVKEGVLAWNKAFEQVGIVDAIEVVQQDKATGAHLDKDPEDVRYNFIRWLSNDVGLAVGPSRAHPETGQILDADIVLMDGWIRHYWHQANEVLPQAAMEGLTAETLRWFDRNPAFDPRVRLAPAPARDRLMAAARTRAMLGDVAYQHICGDACMLGRDDVQEVARRLPSAARLCLASAAKGTNMAFARLVFDAMGAGAAATDTKVEAIDGIPEWLVGPLLADLVAHEVGHTLGLRHNFKASSAYTVEQTNSAEWKGKKPIAGSVMDYLPLNLVLDDKGVPKGDLCMTGIGPYDMWAIEYGYTFEDPTKVLARCTEPELAFGTDEDADGPDPSIRRGDFGGDPLAYARAQLELVGKSRAQILDKFVKPGQSWAKARKGYEITLEAQLRAVSMMADWLGGSFVNRDHKGDKTAQAARKPITPVPVERQRAALKFVLEQSFQDAAFGLTPELLAHMSAERWEEDGSAYTEPTYAVHDQIGGVHATVLSLLLNPTTLRRVYDTEIAVDGKTDVLTLDELLATVSDAVWSELGLGVAAGPARAQVQDATFAKGKVFTPRSPALSSLRRNLQREHFERMLDLTLLTGSSAAERAIALLSRATLERLSTALAAANLDALDAYTRSHLTDARVRIQKALDATYSYGGGGQGGDTNYYFFGSGQAPLREAPR
jgi:hypothetical protein